VRQADVQRAVRALTACGLAVERVEVRAGGVVAIIPTLTGGDNKALSPLEKWRAEHHAGRAAEGA
jgi:hypothetical protein